LQGLVGNWEAKRADDSVTQITYKLVSADSVLLESWKSASGRSDGEEDLTVLELTRRK
jgi:hypothetical protein